MTFSVPVVWKDQKDHHSNYSFCLPSVSEFSSKPNVSIQCPNLFPTVRCIYQDENLQVPMPSERWTLKELSDASGSELTAVFTSLMPHLISQSLLNDLVRDLNV
jgi:hypothetical protein